MAFEKNTVVLCHFSSEAGRLWQASGIDYKNLLKIFSGKILKMNFAVLISAEPENVLAKELKEMLGEQSFLPYGHELGLLKTIFQGETGQVIYFDTPAALFDLSILNKVLEIHQNYGADYTYGENLPPGIIPPVFGRSLFDSFEILSAEKEGSGSQDHIPDELPMTLENFLRKNFNQFHIEIHYEHPDLRMLRLDFTGKSARSLEALSAVAGKVSSLDEPYRELEELYDQNPEMLRHKPSYLEVELYSGCDYHCTFCPRQFLDENPVHQLEAAEIDQIVSFVESGYGDMSIALGGMGEPLQHPRAAEICERLLGAKGLSQLVVETNGAHLDTLLPLLAHPEVQKLRVVVNINSLAAYEALHGVDGAMKERVLKNLNTWKEALGEVNPAHTYLQTLKIVENQKEVNDIYDFSQQLQFSFILQKYNSWIDLMPQKRVSDMTPLERTFCWHLRRDLYLRANGDVAFCKQDLSRNATRGNIKTASLEELWSSGQKDWCSHFRGEYPAAPDCEGCDEYYTFNL